jgi:hypothetical protein
MPAPAAMEYAFPSGSVATRNEGAIRIASESLWKRIKAADTRKIKRLY